MDIETFRSFCFSKKGVEETFPFGDNTLVFKVMNKIFAITSLDGEKFSVNLKCNPERAIELRETYDEIIPGWHMNKKHWNTVDFEGSLDDSFLKELVNHSYDLVVKTLPKKDKLVLEAL